MSGEQIFPEAERLDDIVLADLKEDRKSGKPLVKSPMSLIKDVSIDLRVVLGSASLTCEQLMRLCQGDVLPLDRTVNQPVDLFAGDELVARGRLVAAGDKYGIQIQEVLFSV